MDHESFLTIVAQHDVDGRERAARASRATVAITDVPPEAGRRDPGALGSLVESDEAVRDAHRTREDREVDA